MKYIKTFEKKIKVQDIMDFVGYVADVYIGNTAYFNEYFNGKLTIDDVKKYVNDYVKKRDELGFWGDGDTFDREIFRDVLLFKLGLVNLGELEYDIKPYLTDLEVDVNNYNL